MVWVAGVVVMPVNSWQLVAGVVVMPVTVMVEVVVDVRVKAKSLDCSSLQTLGSVGATTLITGLALR
jgi:hypothetical protein